MNRNDVRPNSDIADSLNDPVSSKSKSTSTKRPTSPSVRRLGLAGHGDLSPDAEESASSAATLTGGIQADPCRHRASDCRPVSPPPEPRFAVEALGWLGVRLTMDMDDWYDPVRRQWGRRQKAPIGANVEFELRRAAHATPTRCTRGVSLKKQRALIDPVWGGVYQYSAAGN